jgi:hypothetical protein
VTGILGDPAGLVGPAFYDLHGTNQIPVAAVLLVVTIDGDEDGTKSTYVLVDGQEPIVTHYGLVQLAAQLLERRMSDAVDSLTGDNEE